MSATVGLGNISGVAVAIAAGGAGAIFWMWLIAFMGMSLKFASCTLSQFYRRINEDGSVLGGPMVYIDDGLAEKGAVMALLGKILGIGFALLCIMGAFGAGNLFQSNQMASQISGLFGQGDNPTVKLIIGVITAAIVATVIIGGIKRIGSVTSKMVPAMCIGYCLVCLFIVLTNFSAVPALIGDIIQSAWAGEALFGGFLGVMVQGMQRAAFSNEAGLGSAAIAHAAAKTKEPVREGAVAMLGPFIDTIIVCTMTALALLITKAHLQEGLSGIEVTNYAFSTVGSWLPPLLTVAVIVFAFSTMISWSYYGERCVEYLFGKAASLPYRILFVLIVIVGPVLSLKNILDFSDIMLLSMAFPNIIALIILSPRIGAALKDYRERVLNKPS